MDKGGEGRKERMVLASHTSHERGEEWWRDWRYGDGKVDCQGGGGGLRSIYQPKDSLRRQHVVNVTSLLANIHNATNAEAVDSSSSFFIGLPQ